MALMTLRPPLPRQNNRVRIRMVRSAPIGRLASAKFPGTPSVGATPATPAASQPPFDPVAENQRGLNTRNLATTLGGLDQQEADVKRVYGLDDPSDPFSRAKLLQRTYDDRQRGTTNSYASQGQLYSGAFQRMQDRNALNYEQGYHGLRDEQNRVLAQIAANRASARSGKEQSDIDADTAALGRAVSVEPDPSTLPAPPVGTKKPAAKVKRRRHRLHHM